MFVHYPFAQSASELQLIMIERAQTIFTNATIIDGTGNRGFVGDVAVSDERVVALGDLSAHEADITVDCTNRVLTPGFIDTHTHDDCALLANPDMAMKVSQGVTTVVAGNCGASLAPLVADSVPAPLNLIGRESPQLWYRFETFADYLNTLDDNPPAVNAACLVGHMTLRVRTMNRTDRPASADEIINMRRLLDASLEAGAAGFSTGLEYEPNMYATTDEVIGVAEGLKKYGAIYATHMRSEGEAIVEAMDETFRIGRACEVPVVVSHFKCYGSSNFGRSPHTIAHLEQAAAHQNVGFDVYPYSAASTILDQREIQGIDRIVITNSTPHPEMAGRDLHEVAAEWSLSLEEAVEKLKPAGATYYGMDEDDVQRILKHPSAMIGSDGIPEDSLPHPRLWGTFPRVLGHYARDVGLFSLEEAVRKMTSLPADRFGFTDRGRIAVGAFADLVVLDPKTIADTASYEAPMSPAAGIERVMANGRTVWCDGHSTGERAGKVLRKG